MAKTLMADGIVDRHESPEDGELLVRITARDKAAFEILYRRYAHRLTKFVGKMIRDRQCAEEVVDDSLFAIWTSASSFGGRSSVSTWIFGIAYRQALKALEREHKHRNVDADTERLESIRDSGHGSDPARETEQTSLHTLVERGMERLSAEHRSTVQLTAMGYSYKEIAAIADCPASTVKTRMFYARKQLKAFVERHTNASAGNERQDSLCAR